MQTFKNLKIIDYDPDRSNLLAFMDILQSKEVEGWPFLKDKAKDYAKNIYKDFREVAVFGSPEICKRTATVWLIISGREVTITNIVPTEVGRLSYDEYNAIFDRFYLQVVKPAAEETNLDTLSSAPEVHIEDLIGHETYEKLRIWEVTCNSDSGNGHPNDFERWADFVTTAFLSQSKINAGLLERWLLEDMNWQDQDVVDRLGSEFEYGINLLEYYVNNK